MSDPHCQSLDTDPAGTPFAALDPARLRAERTSLRWTRYPEDVLPLFVAEMDYTIAAEIKQAITERVEASDFGYLDEAGPLAPVFADFARDRWDWTVEPAHVYLATDVSVGIVEALRLVLPASGGRVGITTPVYPSFFEMLEELPIDIVQIPLSAGASGIRLDLEAIEREFAGGLDALLLCSPHNPHGLLHTEDELRTLALLAAQHGVFVVSDEIHATLTYRGRTFVPFAPLAAEAGALSVTTTSASKGWNLAGAKCSVVVAADARANDLLQKLPPEVACRASIIGLHANIAAFRDARDWLDRAIALIEANDELLAELVETQLPGVRYTRPEASYLAWLDFRDAGLGDDPHRRILNEAKVALGRGPSFGLGGEGHVRVNLACAPDTLREAVTRISAILPANSLTNQDPQQ